jgi:hypothetical protein
MHQIGCSRADVLVQIYEGIGGVEVEDADVGH